MPAARTADVGLPLPPKGEGQKPLRSHRAPEGGPPGLLCESCDCRLAEMLLRHFSLGSVMVTHALLSRGKTKRAHLHCCLAVARWCILMRGRRLERRPGDRASHFTTFTTFIRVVGLMRRTALFLGLASGCAAGIHVKHTQERERTICAAWAHRHRNSLAAMARLHAGMKRPEPELVVRRLTSLQFCYTHLIERRRARSAPARRSGLPLLHIQPGQQHVAPADKKVVAPTTVPSEAALNTVPPEAEGFETTSLISRT